MSSDPQHPHKSWTCWCVSVTKCFRKGSSRRVEAGRVLVLTAQQVLPKWWAPGLARDWLVTLCITRHRLSFKGPRSNWSIIVNFDMRGRRKRRRRDGYKAGSYDPDLLLGCGLALHRETAFREAEGRQKHPSYHEVAARSRGLRGEQAGRTVIKKVLVREQRLYKGRIFPGTLNLHFLEDSFWTLCFGTHWGGVAKQMTVTFARGMSLALSTQRTR